MICAAVVTSLKTAVQSLKVGREIHKSSIAQLTERGHRCLFFVFNLTPGARGIEDNTM